MILSAPPGTNYQWNTGDTTNSLVINSAGDFSYSMISMFGCPKNSDTLSTEVYLKPYINLGTDTMICNTSAYLIDAGPGYNSYLWQDGSSNQVFLASTSSSGIDSMIYFVDVTDVNSCANRDSVFVRFDVCQNIKVPDLSEANISLPGLIHQGESFSALNFSNEKIHVNFNTVGGQKLFDFTCMPGRTTINGNIFKPGVYFYSVISQNRIMQSGKLVVQ